MRKTAQVLFFFVVILQSLSSFAFLSHKDSTAVRDTIPIVNIPVGDLSNTRIERNFDSLLSLFYVQNSLKMQDSSRRGANFTVSDLPDSVYINRLKKIPCLVDVSYNDVVKKWIKLYTQRSRVSSEVMLGLMEHYFPIFEEVFDNYGIPLELKYVSIIESALNPKAVSYAGATGIWQFMYGTAKMYSLEINSFIDERRDPYKATEAAAKYFKDLYAIYGDWNLVLAAYNCGPGIVNRAIKRAKGKTNYWDIYPYLPYDTRNYVPAYIAAIYFGHYYKEHNLSPVKIQTQINDTVMVTQKLHLQQVADILGINIEQLRDLNPQYKKDIIPANSKPYALKLPANKASQFAAREQEIYHYKDSLLLTSERNFVSSTSNKKNDSKSKKSSKTSVSNDESDIPEFNPTSVANKTKLIYNVKQGDNYGFIATWYNVSLNELKMWNQTNAKRLQIGQKIIVYVPNNKVSQYKDIDAMTNEQKQEMLNKTAVQNLASANKNYVTTSASIDESFVYYTLKSGDVLPNIVKMYSGVTVRDVMQLNNFSERDVRKLKPGQVIKIKRK